MTKSQRFLIRMKKKLVGKNLSLADVARTGIITNASLSNALHGKTNLRVVNILAIEAVVKELVGG